MVGATDQGACGANVFFVRNIGNNGSGHALHHGRTNRLPPSTVRGLCRRRRLFHADGGFCDGGALQTSDQGHRDFQRDLGADQVGTNGVPRQPGIWLRPSSDRLCEVC